MQDEKPPPVSHYVNGLRQNGDATEAMVGEIAKSLVMVTGNINDACSLARFAQDFLDHVIMLLTPIPGFTHAPDVDDITDKIQVIRVGMP